MKKTYEILFNSTMKNDVEFTGTLEGAMERADELAECTQKDIVIMLKERTAAKRKWHGVEYSENEPHQEKPICYPNIGYYSDWEL